MTEKDPFEFGGEPLKTTITLREQSRDYFLHDISKGASDKLFAPLQSAGDDKAKALAANRDLTNKVVAAVVRRLDGTPITEQEASEMRAALVNKLALKAFAFLSDEDVDAAGERSAEKGPESEGKKD